MIQFESHSLHGDDKNPNTQDNNKLDFDFMGLRQLRQESECNLYQNEPVKEKNKPRKREMFLGPDYDEVYDLMVDKKGIYPYKAARTVQPSKKGGRWYIEYYAYCTLKNGLVRRRWYEGFDKLTTTREKIAHGVKHCKALNQVLPNRRVPSKPEQTKDGLLVIPQTAKVLSEKRIDDPFYTVMWDVVISKYKFSPKKTYDNYKYVNKGFLLFLQSVGMHGQTAREITPQVCQAYIDSIRHQAQNTQNSKSRHLRTLFNHMVNADIIDKNPWDKLTLPKKVSTMRNTAYSSEQIKSIKDDLMTHNPYLYNVCSFIYYTYMRPIEMRRLQVKDVLLSERKIRVSHEIAKNRKTQYITIPEQLVEVIEQLGYHQGEPSDLLFGKDYKPGKVQFHHATWSRYYGKMRTKLGIDPIHTMYSWKHTGVTEAYKAGVGLKAIQLQCRHSSIQMTDVYLKSLGFLDNTEFTQGIPTI